MAAARYSSSSYKFQTWVTLLYRNRVVSGGSWLSRQDLPCGSVDQGLRFLSGNSTSHVGNKLAMGKCQIADRVQLPAPYKNGFTSWMKWTLGCFLSLILPLLGKTWNNVLRLEGKVEVVAEEVGVVATVAYMVLKEVAEELPNDKEAAEVMEHLCGVVAAQDSKLVHNLIHKAAEVKQDLEDMDTMIQTAVVGNVQLGDGTKKPT